MSFLVRLSLRARPTLSRLPALMPKGAAARQPMPVFRAADPEDEEEQAQPLRRAARTIRRAEETQPEEEMQRAEAPREDEDKDEEPPAMARRATGPIRRAEEEQEEEPTEAARLIRRAEEVPIEDGEKPLRQPFQQDLSPGSAPLPPEMADKEEPPAMQALRREAAVLAPPQRDATRPAVPDGRDAANPRTGQGDAFAANIVGGAGAYPALSAGFQTDHDAAFGSDGSFASQAPQRPQVIIDQVDVLIHEPTPQAAVSSRPLLDSSRAMRARYLRRL